MDFLKDSAFWWAIVASIWAITSDYLASNPKVRANGVSQLLISLITNAIQGQAQSSGRRRRRR
jgi:hypothetical protein